MFLFRTIKKRALRVGAVGCTFLSKRISQSKPGTLVCTCGRGGYFALYKGGLGKCCHKPEEVSAQGRNVYTYRQLPSTKVIRKRCLAYIRENGMTPSQFGRLTGVGDQRFRNWNAGILSQKGQVMINGELADFFQSLEVNAQTSATGVPA